jgi:predicted transglutaminase-like cysteine proteinase
MSRFRLSLASAALCAVMVAAAFAKTDDLGFSRSVTAGLVARDERLFGGDARGRLERWKEFVRSTGGRTAPARGKAGLLSPVNGFFNRLPSISDSAHWGVQDYWATPSEFQASDGGDCEDYAIAKYFTLKELGVPIVRLRLVYARTWRSAEAHMVLAYYPDPGADPLILDSLEDVIEPASDRPDLTPVFLFNDDDLQFLQQGASGAHHDALSIRKWRDLLGKLARELTY